MDGKICRWDRIALFNLPFQQEGNKCNRKIDKKAPLENFNSPPLKQQDIILISELFHLHFFFLF